MLLNLVNKMGYYWCKTMYTRIEQGKPVPPEFKNPLVLSFYASFFAPKPRKHESISEGFERKYSSCDSCISPTTTLMDG